MEIIQALVLSEPVSLKQFLNLHQFGQSLLRSHSFSLSCSLLIDSTTLRLNLT